MNAFSQAEEKFIFRETDDMMLDHSGSALGKGGSGGAFPRVVGGRNTVGKVSANASQSRLSTEDGGGARSSAKFLPSAGSSSPKTNAPPPVPVEPKLRSKVLLTQPSKSSDYKNIRLDTYYDSSDVYRALAKIQEACDYGLNEEEELSRMTAHDPSILTGPWMKRPGGAGRGVASRRLNDLSPEILLRCFGFCDLKSLGTLRAVSNRFYVLTNAHNLWLPHAQARRVPVSDPRHARRDLREFILAKKREKEKEVLDCEGEYERLAKRMKERSDAIRAEPVNIDATLGNHNPDAILNGNYKKTESGGRVLVSSAFVKNIQETLENLELLRNEVMDRMDANNRKLNAQQDQLLALEARLDRAKHSSRPSSPAPNDLSAADLNTFERRMVRLVLNGSNLASTAEEDSAEVLPVVLRRGITDFGTLDLLCIDTSLPEAVIKPVKARYTALKRFFPLNDDYYTVRAIVENNANSADKMIPKKCEALYAKTAALIQRIQGMKDGEVLSIVM